MRFSTINNIDSFDSLLGTLSIIQYLRIYGKANAILETYKNMEICLDFEYELFYDALSHSVEFFSYQYCENHDFEELFISDSTMNEYYKLSYAYGHKHNLPANQNPYIKNADDFVCDSMNEIQDHGFQWKISRGTKHKYASAIHVYKYPDFIQIVSLVQSVLEIFEFYHDEVAKLREELNPT